MPRYQSRPVMAQPIASNRGQLFESLASRLSQFTEQRDDELDIQMQKKAKEQGLIDAQGKTEITLKTGQTIADENWNKGALVSHMAAIKLDVTEQADRIFTENPEPEAFEAAFKGYSNGLLAGVPKSMQPKVTDELSSIGLNLRIKAERNQRSIQLAERKATGGAALDLLQSEALDNIDSLSIDDAGEKQDEYNTLVDVMMDDTSISRAEGAKLKENLNGLMDEQIVIGQFKTTLDNGTDKDFLKKFESKELGHFFSPLDREKLLTKMLGMRNRRDSIDKIKKETASKDIRKYLKAKENGFDISKQETARVTALANDADLLDDFLKADDDIEKINHYGRTSTATRRAKIDELGESGKLEDFNKWQALKKADARIIKAAQDDGYQLAVSQGIIEATEVDYQNPATFQSRNEQAKMLSSHYGVEVSPFTDAEVTQLVGGLQGMTPDEKGLLAMSIGSMDNSKVLKEITKKQAPVFAMVAAIGDEQIANDVFTGQAELDAGNVTLPAGIDKEEMLANMYDYLGNVYSGEDLAATRKAIFAHYANAAGNADYDEDVLEASAKAITGGVATFNNFSIELPRGIESDDMEDFVDGFSGENVTDIGGVDNRTPEDAARMIRDGIWRSRGSNSYAIITPFGELMQNGKPLRIKYDAALQKQHTLTFEEFMERQQ